MWAEKNEKQFFACWQKCQETGGICVLAADVSLSLSLPLGFIVVLLYISIHLKEIDRPTTDLPIKCPQSWGWVCNLGIRDSGT